MSSKKSRKRASSEAADYASDGGFIVNSDGDEAAAPTKKKAKTSKGSKEAAKANRTEAAAGGGQQDGDDTFWEISNTRRVVISEFKGKKMINIREYYEKDGQSLPGRKGISLPIEQYSKFLEILPFIEETLAQTGVEVSRPSYGGVYAHGKDDGLQTVEDEEERSTSPIKRSNIEETSDEGE